MLLSVLGNLISKKYRFILILGSIITLTCAILMSQLKMNMQMMDLLPSKEPEVKAYEKALNNFEGLDSIILVVEGDKSNIIDYIINTKDYFAEIDFVKEIEYRIEKEFLKKNSLLLIKRDDLKSIDGMLNASSLSSFIKGLNDNFEREYIASSDNKKISKDEQTLLHNFNTIESFLLLLANDKNNRTNHQQLSNKNNHTNQQIQQIQQIRQIKDLSDEFLVGPEYMISTDQKMGIIIIKPSISMTDIEKLVSLVDTIENKAKQYEKKFDVKTGLAGMLVVQRDEMVVTQKDMKITSILALILVLLIFFFSFRLMRYTLLAVIPLIAGIIISLGVTYLIIGSLNVFTALMGAILVGLGIDYAIHIIAIFTEARSNGESVNNAVRLVFQKTARGVITGAITTAIGFMMFFLSDFPGFREFGIVLGIGIICTLLASLFLLPALLMIFGKKEIKSNKVELRSFKIYQYLIFNKKYLVLIFTLLLVILSLVKFNDLKFSSDLKDIEPKNLKSLVLNDKIIEKFDFSSDNAIFISPTIDHLQQAKEKIDDLDSIGYVDSLANYLPSEEKQKLRIKFLRQMKKKLPSHPETEVNIMALKKEINRLQDNLIELSDLAFIGGDKKIVNKIDNIINSNIFNLVIESIKNNKKRILEIQKIFIGNLIDYMKNTNMTKILSLNDIPHSIKEKYQGKDQTFLTTLYPKGDVWNEKFQPLYLSDLNLLNIPITGTFILSNKVMNVAGKEGKKILLLVIVSIFLLLVLDFRSFKYASLAMLPMGLSLVILIGIMSWLGIAFNYVNIIALPIIIGIGVDDGVHLIHRYLIEKDILPAFKSTGRGILLSTLTTGAAFGTLILSSYQGFSSFGLVLLIGVVVAYFLTLGTLISLILIIDNKIFNKKHAVFLILFNLIFVNYSSVFGSDEILVKMDQVANYETVKMKASMMIINEDNAKTTMKLISYEKTKGDKILMRFVYPARLKGTAILSVSDDIWYYNRRTNRTRLLSRSAKQGSMMGSGFSYDDIGQNYQKDFHASILEDNTDSYLLKLVPKDNDKNYKYLKCLVLKKNYIATKVEYYKDNDKKYKEMKAENIKTIDNYIIPLKVTMVDFVDQKTTEFIIDEKSLEYNVNIDDKIFSHRNLTKN